MRHPREEDGVFDARRVLERLLGRRRHCHQETDRNRRNHLRPHGASLNSKRRREPAAMLPPVTKDRGECAWQPDAACAATNMLFSATSSPELLCRSRTSEDGRRVGHWRATRGAFASLRLAPTRAATPTTLIRAAPRSETRATRTWTSGRLAGCDFRYSASTEPMARSALACESAAA